MFAVLSKDMYESNREQGKRHIIVKELCPEIFNNKDLILHTSKRFLLKVQWYAVEMLWLCDHLNRLFAKDVNAQVQRTYIYAALLIAISDWYIDDTEDAKIGLEKLFYDTHNFRAETFLEQYYVKYFQYFEQSLEEEHCELVLKYFYKVHRAQFASQTQCNPKISKADIDNITKAKSAYLTLLALAFAKTKLSQAEKEAFYELGSLVQCINDIQDLHKDTLVGIRNFANVRSSLSEVQKDLLEQKNLAFQKIKMLDLDRKQELEYFLFTFEAFTIVTQARLQFYRKACKSEFTLEDFTKIPKEKLNFNVFGLSVVAQTLPQILNVKV